MNGVYVAIVIAVALVLIVLLIRGRLTHIGGKADLQKQKGEFTVLAAKPAEPKPNTMRTQDNYSIDISDNKVIGLGAFRIFRNQVRATRNWILGKSEIEVGDNGSHKIVGEDKSRKIK